MSRPAPDARPAILLAFASAHDGDLRHLPEERRELQAILEDAERQNLCELIPPVVDATSDEVTARLQEDRFRDRVAIVHFGGHADSYHLVFETRAGQPDPSRAEAFAELLGQQRGVSLVFLNGCSTGRQVEALHRAGISAVIATSRAIADDRARAFAKVFYRGLAGGATLRVAFNEAAATTREGIDPPYRELFVDGVADDLLDEVPWTLSIRPGAEETEEWNLPDEVANCLFGLPEVSGLPLPDPPFRYIERLTRDYAPLFFGRDCEIRDLYRIVTTGAASIVLLYGQSGVGKSSLLEAGLIPRLEAVHEVRSARRLRDLGLLGSLRRALGGANDIAQGWRALEAQSDKPLTIILDQVEEAITQPRADGLDELDGFFDTVTDLFYQRDPARKGRLILGFRKEWFAEIEDRVKARRLFATTFLLYPMRAREIVQVVTGLESSQALKDHYRLNVEPELPQIVAAALLADPETPVAPTLQVLLTRMWAEAKKESRNLPRFTVELFRTLEREGLALGDFLDRQLNAFQADHSAALNSGLVLDLLEFHTGDLGQSEQHSYAELRRRYRHVPELPQLLERAKSLYLLSDPSSDHAADQRDTRLAHDTLGPIVRQRYERSDKAGQRARRILTARVAGEGTGAILGERDLRLVEAGLGGMRSCSEAERKLVEASRRELASLNRSLRRIWLTASAALGAGVAVGVFRAVLMLTRNLLASAGTTALSPFTTLFVSSYIGAIVGAAAAFAVLWAEAPSATSSGRARALVPGWRTVLAGAVGFGAAHALIGIFLGGEGFLFDTPLKPLLGLVAGLGVGWSASLALARRPLASVAVMMPAFVAVQFLFNLFTTGQSLIIVEAPPAIAAVVPGLAANIWALLDAASIGAVLGLGLVAGFRWGFRRLEAGEARMRGEDR